MRARAWLVIAVGAGIVTGAACTTGSIGDRGGDPGSAPIAIDGVGKMGMRRLTRKEYDATLADLLSDETQSGFKSLPEDVRDPFDNDFTGQIASQALIDSVETLAEAASARALAKSDVRAKIVPCTPTGPDDAACFTTFVKSFGRRALRRTLSDDDVAGFVGLQSFAIESGDFWVGVDTVIRAMLQDPRFLYRIEIGTPIDGRPGVFMLDSWEVASRLSYFLWGSMPDDTLLDAAERGELSTPDQVRAQAERLLASPRAQDRIERFHALWLGYEQLPHSADMVAAMKKESAALIDRVVFEKKGSWLDLFQSNDTYIDDLLAKNYGLPSPGATPAWVPYGSSGRKGILSHGSFLSVSAKFDDTSPTQRGILIRTRLMCQTIPPPPPTVNTDMPPAGDGASKCKVDRYAMHRQGGCASCHNRMDPVGFGLENYDQQGKFRDVEAANPECKIEGKGNLTEVGDFHGPAELGDKLIESGLLQKCAVTQLYRFAMGHREADEDQPYLDDLTSKFTSGGHKFDRLIVDLAGSEWFLYRREEQ
jgi:hypothetical protein